MSVKTIVRVCFCVLAIFGGGFGAGGVVWGQGAQTGGAEGLAGVKVGQRVSALIGGKWTDCTLVSREGDAFTVSVAYPNWPDEIYPFGSIKVNGKVVTVASELKAGEAISVQWGSEWSPARVVEAKEGQATIRWDRSDKKMANLQGEAIKAMEQGPVRAGKVAEGVGIKQEGVLRIDVKSGQPGQPGQVNQQGQAGQVVRPHVNARAGANRGEAERGPEQKGTRFKLQSYGGFDEKRMQFLTLTNEPAAGLKLTPGDGKPELTTNANGEVEIKDLK